METKTYDLIAISILIISILLILFFTAAWISSLKVSGRYRFIKQESRKTPSLIEKQYIQKNLRNGKFPGGKLILNLGVMSSELILLRPNGTLFKKFKGDRPLWYHANIREVNPQTNKYINNNTKWSYEYIRIINGYPNIKITQWDSNNQFIRKWVYTVDAPLKPVRIY